MADPRCSPAGFGALVCLEDPGEELGVDLGELAAQEGVDPQRRKYSIL